ncbi:MAG: DegT/DnrJ/EryC1/StrS family aminotransferase, partial [Chloroflexota bacterium]
MTVVTQEIPLVDLKAQYATIRDEVRQAIDEVLESMQLTIGPNVRAFDTEWAAYCGTTHAIGVGSGTDALQLAIRACGVSSGDEVITVSHTFFATVEAIVYANARPILVDIDERTMLMDIGSVASRITPRTKAIVPVHLYGRTVDLRPLRQLAQDRGITIIEDAAQAHGALLDDGKRAGTGGRANCFSFYCSKNLGAYGEAGSITTNDEKLADDLRALREHGQSTRYYHPIVGYNARLDEIQAAILRIKLRRLDQWNARRQEIAARYNELLSGGDIVTPEIPAGGRHVFYCYAIRVPGGRRDALRAYLTEHGVGTQIHYPVPIHMQDAAQFLGYR